MQGWLGGQWMGGKTPRDFMAPAIGKASYTDPKYATWWKYFGMLRDKGYLNDDYESIQLYQGMEEFMAGKGAIQLWRIVFSCQLDKYNGCRKSRFHVSSGC